MPDRLASAEISSSWRRSEEAGVDANEQTVPYSSDFDSDSLLVAAARPVLSRLADRLAEQPIGIVLADATGRVVQRIDPSSRSRRVLDRIYLAPGFDFHEAHIGTNAIGTALATRAGVRVDSAQHFRGQFLDYVCVAAPIRDPATGEVIGIVDLSSLSDDAQPFMDDLMRRTAGLIQENVTRLRGSAGRPEAHDVAGHAGPFLASSPLSGRFCSIIKAELALTRSLLVLGESGIGKVRIVMQAFDELSPGGVVRVIPVQRLNGQVLDAEQVRHLVSVDVDGPFERTALASEALLVLQNVHELTQVGVKNLLALGHAWQAQRGHRPVVATADDRELDDDAPVLTVQSYFDRMVQLPVSRPEPRRARNLSWLEQAEYSAICRALNQVSGNRARAASLLGIARSSLYRKLRQYGIDSDAS